MLPFLLMGIDTHDFESGRFLYFTSVLYLILLVGSLSILLRKRVFQITILLIFLYFFIFNRIVVENWKVSSAVVRTATRTLPLNKQSVFVDNVPDSYNGAYIFRNGLFSAFVFAGSEQMRVREKVKIRKVDWDDFLYSEKIFFGYSVSGKNEYLDRLRSSYEAKYSTQVNEPASFYIFTSKGLIYLGELKSN
jgi:hypothetical protein